MNYLRSSGSVLKMIIPYAFAFLICLLLIDHYLLPGLLQGKNFIIWDAANYHMITESGYVGKLNAFFPLFPMIWKGLSGSVAGIIAFNAILFLLAYIVLVRLLDIKGIEILLYLTIPGFIFFYLPYSESLFFASSVLLLIGLQRKKVAMVLTGLFLCTLTRPVVIILVPALIITEILVEPLKWKLLRKSGLYILVALAGLLAVAVVQYQYTGEWFSFYKSQSYWGNMLQLPHLPLTSWSDGMIVRLDGAAFLTGTISGGALLFYIVKYFRKQPVPPAEVIFSLCYLGGITLFILLFRGGSLFSLNRFVFAVPFIIVAGHFFLASVRSFTLKDLAVAFSLILLFWFLFGSYGHIQTFLKFALLTLYLSLIPAIKSEQKYLRIVSYVALILINFIFQLILISRFLSSGWVG